MDKPEPDCSYFERRASEEQAAAERCRSEPARTAHHDLARRYRQAALEHAGGRAGRRLDDRQGMMPLLSPEFRIIN